MTSHLVKKSKITPSSEQLAFITSPQPAITLQAPAGSGKTLTIVERIKHLKTQGQNTGLFLFDRANTLEAKKRVGRAANVQTFHSLAYQYHAGLLGKEVLKERTTGAINPAEAAELIPWSKFGVSQKHRLEVTGVMLKILTNYCSTAEKTIDQRHLTSSSLVGIISSDALLAMTHYFYERCLTDNRMPLSFDVILKSYQLSNPYLDLDNLIVDEGQDTNPVCFDIVKNQILLSHQKKRARTTNVAIVGDKDQSIYLFRNAVNALHKFEEIGGVKRYALTQSRRFGSKIGFLAQSTINNFKIHDPIKIKGINSEPEKLYVYSTDEEASNYARDTLKRQLSVRKLMEDARENKRTTMILCRSLLGVIEACLTIAKINKEINEHKSDHELPYKLAGGVQKYGFDRFVQAARLKAGQLVTDPLLKNFHCWEEFDAFAKTTDSNDLKSMVSFVKRYGSHSEQVIKGLKARNLDAIEYRDKKKYGTLPSDKQNRPHVVVSSAHRAKGLEADSIMVWDDFKSFETVSADMQNSAHDSDHYLAAEQEINLAYVAITRARSKAILPSSWRTILNVLSSDSYRFI